MAKATWQEVVEFFKTADKDMASLVLELSTNEVNKRQATSEKISANLKKARAARKPKATAQATDANTASVPAPATIGSTGVESDSEFAQAVGNR